MEEPPHSTTPDSRQDQRSSVGSGSGGLRDQIRAAEAILFLCSGNIMRSAFCELYARHLACPLPVASAATIYNNTEIHPATVEALERRGVSSDAYASFGPRKIERVLPHLPSATLILGMDGGHLAVLPPEVRRERAALVSALLGSSEPVPDPISHSDPQPVFDHLARCVDALQVALH